MFFKMSLICHIQSFMCRLIMFVLACHNLYILSIQENLHILRDLSMLQVHMRDLEGYRVSILICRLRLLFLLHIQAEATMYK